MQRVPALAILLVLPHLLWAQANPQTSGPNACQLLSKADLERVTGEKIRSEGMPVQTGCIWDPAQLHILSGNLEQRLDTMTKSFAQRGAKPESITGLGERAMSFAPEPRDKYDDRAVYVVVQQGRYLVQTAVRVPKGKTATDVRPQALELAKLVLPKLK
jgi:hypothetical protein